MWDQRYSALDYAYGKSPNEFLKESLQRFNLQGKALFPAEGEGRNAVYAAGLGLEVYAYDISELGKEKAQLLAKENGVKINYSVGPLEHQAYDPESFDVIGLIYAHLPEEQRIKAHSKLTELLKPGGYVILEGFSEGNLPYREKNPAVGGPPRQEMLLSIEKIKAEFRGLNVLQLEDIEVELNEGKYHKGIGRVIRFIGKKG